MIHILDPGPRPSEGRLLLPILLNFLKYVFCLAACALFLNPVPAVHGETRAPRGFLWEVQNGRTSVYLAGSIHLQKAGTPLPDGYLAAFRRCNVLYFETDIQEFESPESVQRMMQAGLLPRGERLDQRLQPATRAALRRFVDARGMPDDFIQRLRPWLCALTLALQEMQRIGYDPQEGVDRRLFRLGLDEGKSMGGLETLDEQIELFGGLTPAQEEDFLRQTLADLQTIEKTAAAMMETWRTGDAPALAALLEQSFAGYPDVYARFLTERNRRWAEKTAALLNRGSLAMVVVGAGHLVGDDSILQELVSMGYRVKRLGGTDLDQITDRSRALHFLPSPFASETSSESPSASF